nr:hypothetical protein TQ38_23100 [Novosphingobium sp. P6W]
MGYRALLAAGLGGLFSTSAQAAPDCAASANFRLELPAKVKISGAEHVAATIGKAGGDPLPAHCRVSGTINERRGADGKTYAIGFTVALPDSWNGRLLFQGGGGLNGIIQPPVGRVATGARPALAKGFAVVSTDSGHKSGGGGFDASFRVDQQAALDFAHASVGTTTLAAKQIVASHYGRAAHHSYIVGCSTGGREAMLAAQRYPDLFDGVVSGAPAMRPGFSGIMTAHIAAALNQASRRDAEGKPLPLFSSENKAQIRRELLKQCDRLDGLADGVIAKVGACAFQPSRIVCKDGRTADCLAPSQVRALEVAFAPVKDAAGATVYPAFPWDTGIVASGSGIPGILTNGQAGPLGPSSAATSIDVEARLRAVRSDAMQALTETYTWTNLSTFFDRGGKIVWYHGVSDPWFSAMDTQDYYERAAADNGPRFLGSSRLFMVPGAGHCEGGDNTFDQFDLLSAVVEWTEKGIAPDRVTATRLSPGKGERPLCPFPSYPFYRGTGDPMREDSFECRKDATTKPGQLS